jgi:hypothetical protein
MSSYVACFAASDTSGNLPKAATRMGFTTTDSSLPELEAHVLPSTLTHARSQLSCAFRLDVRATEPCNASFVAMTSHSALPVADFEPADLFANLAVISQKVDVVADGKFTIGKGAEQDYINTTITSIPCDTMLEVCLHFVLDAC